MITQFDTIMTATIRAQFDFDFVSIPTRVYLVDVDTVVCECRLPLAIIPNDVMQDMANMLEEAGLHFRVHHVEYIGMLDLQTVIYTNGLDTWTEPEFSI